MSQPLTATVGKASAFVTQSAITGKPIFKVVQSVTHSDGYIDSIVIGLFESYQDARSTMNIYNETVGDTFQLSI